MKFWGSIFLLKKGELKGFTSKQNISKNITGKLIEPQENELFLFQQICTTRLAKQLFYFSKLFLFCLLVKTLQKNSSFITFLKAKKGLKLLKYMGFWSIKTSSKLPNMCSNFNFVKKYGDKGKKSVSNSLTEKSRRRIIFNFVFDVIQTTGKNWVTVLKRPILTKIKNFVDILTIQTWRNSVDMNLQTENTLRILTETDMIKRWSGIIFNQNISFSFKKKNKYWIISTLYEFLFGQHDFMILCNKNLILTHRTIKLVIVFMNEQDDSKSCMYVTCIFKIEKHRNMFWVSLKKCTKWLKFKTEKNS